MSTQPVPQSGFFTYLPKVRASLPPAEFRQRLRETMLADPHMKLAEIASALGVTRQAVGQMVGRLDRPRRTAPRKEQARARLNDLRKRVSQGEPAARAAAALAISLPQAYRLGFRAHAVRPTHGTQERLASGCNCWQCRRAGGLALPRSPSTPQQRAEALDWLAWTDPDDGRSLSQAKIGALTGISQAAVSRLARSEKA